ncbi:REP-associated tyrosine transposase [Rhodoplanes sp. SY1]|uniref:REP-associated tyrosine transposase n=1 Tax=Rhodoplanes sp. SY1 TaxID=3166646 RepID=UPI0038B5F136
MVRYRRNFVPGGTYFFTVTLADRSSTALVDHVDLLRSSFRHARRERPFGVEAIVILPDHLHVIMTLPDGDTDFPGRWRRIKSLFSHGLATRLPLRPDTRGRYGIWQRRFWEHTIRDDDDLVRHVDYVHINPVKHGYVGRVRDWPYSSFHRYVRDGLLPLDWAGDAEPGAYGER